MRKPVLIVLLASAAAAVVVLLCLTREAVAPGGPPAGFRPARKAPRSGSVARLSPRAGRSPAPAYAQEGVYLSDPFPGAELVSSVDSPSVRPDCTRRRRLLRTDSKYPLVLVDEIVPDEDEKGAVLRRISVVADHILVVLRPTASLDRLNRFNRRFDAWIRKALHTPRHYLVAFPSVDTETVFQRLADYEAATDIVEAAALDALLARSDTTPNDPLLGTLWGMTKIRAPAAWDTATGDGSVVAGVVDTGVDYDHEDLAQNIWRNPGETGLDTNGLGRATNGVDDDANGFIDDVYGWDFYNEDNDPMDDHSHGSHCAGTIAAAGNNGTGVVGVAWSARIMALKFMYPLGDGRAGGWTSDAIECLNYATMMATNGVNIKVTNNSWGGGPYSTPLKNAIEASGDAGMIFAVAAGNGGTDTLGDNIEEIPFFPAKFDSSNIICVANTTQSDGLDVSSNYGTNSVDLGAPGSQIRSTTPGNTYSTKSGTSMATPHVAGMVVLVTGLRPDLDVAETVAVILAGTDPLPALDGKVLTGGRLNAENTVALLAPEITHTPLINTTNTATAIAVEASIRPGFLLDTNRVFLLWNTDGATNRFTTNTMTRIGGITNATFHSTIPPQPFGTLVQYFVEAEAQYGLVTRHPATAPAVPHSFSVTFPVELTVTGTPLLVGTVLPDYGRHTFASGIVVTASGMDYSHPVGGARYVLTGWRGTGSVPATGTANTVSFTILQDSALEWQWDVQYGLKEVMDVPGMPATTNWWDLGTTAHTAVAEACMATNGTTYCFAEWWLDGARYPDATNVALNPVTGILMTTSHVARAIYVPETSDSDGDGLWDWWEQYYWGTTAASASDDGDGDGYTNALEFLDRTNPRDPASKPAPPHITHTPLSDPQRTPPPWTVTAIVTDNYELAEVTLWWGRLGAPLGFTNMVVPDGQTNLFTAAIPPPGTNGDMFIYQIEARDPMGNAAYNGLHLFEVVYPDARVLPTDAFDVLLQPGMSTALQFAVTNAGLDSLTWELQFGWQDNMEQGTNGWRLGPGTDLWRISTNRSWSPTRAWYSRLNTGSFGGPAGHARLDTPPLRLGVAARLIYRQWIHSEIDTGSGWEGYAFDGGLVEISTNGGETFEHIVPEGGYPYRIHAWMTNRWMTNSQPWDFDTPCFAGTGEWEHVEFDLRSYAGTEAILRFHYGGDDNTDREGWYIDDLLVYSAPGSNTWFAYAPTSGVLEAASGTNINVSMDAGNLLTGDWPAVLRLLSNDPYKETLHVQFLLHVRTPPQVAVPFAAQVSTNGEGYVILSNRVYDVDGDTCSLAVEYTTNGIAWTNALIPLADPAFGFVTVSNGGPAQVLGVQTAQDGQPQTNTVTAAWNTTNPPGVTGLATNVRVRVRAWDGFFWSGAATSLPFVVDNEAPSAPPSLTVSSHMPEWWSTNPLFTVQWGPASDGGGTGVRGYGVRIGHDPANHAPAVTTTGTWSHTMVPTDGTDLWVTVCAFDVHGNRGPAADAGPYCVDLTPPSSSMALVVPARSAYGDYVFGSAVTCSWSGFSDELSGISGYYVSFTDHGGTTNGMPVTGAPAVLTGAALDRTNRIYVWARDNLGLIGQAANASILALNPTNDYDLDGMSGADESVAGTDASDPDSVLSLATFGGVPAGTNLMVVRWDTELGRFYSLFRAPDLTSEWARVPAVSNVPGTGGGMSYTDTVDGVEMRFYRIRAAYP